MTVTVKSTLVNRQFDACPILRFIFIVIYLFIFTVIYLYYHPSILKSACFLEKVLRNTCEIINVLNCGKNKLPQVFRTIRKELYFRGSNFHGQKRSRFSRKFLPSKIVKRKIAKVFSSENKNFS